MEDTWDNQFGKRNRKNRLDLARIGYKHQTGRNYAHKGVNRRLRRQRREPVEFAHDLNETRSKANFFLSFSKCSGSKSLAPILTTARKRDLATMSAQSAAPLCQHNTQPIARFMQRHQNSCIGIDERHSSR